MLVDGFLGPQSVFKISGQLFLLEKLLRVVVIVANALIANAVNKREALGPVYRLCGQVDELLRILLEVVQRREAIKISTRLRRVKCVLSCKSVSRSGSSISVSLIDVKPDVPV